jgi:hypothetical protein
MRHGIGFLVGAASGATLRFVVTLLFTLYLSHHGSRWWRGAELYWPAFVSAGLGLIIGGVSGSTCRPVLGAVLGGVLSAGSCWVLIVLPTELAISMSGGPDAGVSPQLRSELVAGVIAMTIAGALAGGLGGMAGYRRRKALGREKGTHLE